MWITRRIACFYHPGFFVLSLGGILVQLGGNDLDISASNNKHGGSGTSKLP